MRSDDSDREYDADEDEDDEEAQRPQLKKTTLKVSEFEDLRDFDLVVTSTSDKPIKFEQGWSYSRVDNYICSTLFPFFFLKFVDDLPEKRNPWYNQPNMRGTAAMEEFLPRWTVAYRVSLLRPGVSSLGCAHSEIGITPEPATIHLSQQSLR